MNLKRRILSTILTMSVIMIMCAVPTVAASYKHSSTTASNEGHSSFSKAWKDYGSLKVGKNYYDFTYGYDTWASKEDYITAVYAQKNNSKTYYGKIMNSKGTTDVTDKQSGVSKTDKADVKHTGKTVTYYVYAR